jgi:signal peptidase I
VQREPTGEWVDEDGTPFKEYIETLPNGVRHRIIERSDDAPYDNTDVYVVPAGHYFGMGDNRDNSADSRANVGYIPEENLVGRASFLFYSTAYERPLWEIWRSLPETRLGRIFTGIH